MNCTNYIANRLSLRAPQVESLNILGNLADQLTLKKGGDLEAELQKVNHKFPTCTDFERKFPSICFALATGVGKTRLMGAFITYLYLEKKIKNFFVLAPNLTIYNKLMNEFSNPAGPKYVFRGIGEFVHIQPEVITGDNYQYFSQRQTQIFDSIHINVFNISKINAETRKGTTPRIKRMSEYLGDSYFNYLSNLDDLVLLMDESHHYRADRGMEVINELNPILGLELTATPQVERKGGAIKFKNTVYEYSLAKAIRDGFVKEPAVATRKNFDPSQYTSEDLDHLKSQDGLNIHEDTKSALEIYAKDNKVKVVKPFVLIIAKDTDHAGRLKEWIMSDSCFQGVYKDKVMEIHSNQRGGEKAENITRLISLEHPDNTIEIVIHVNMLKEGWDVTNLYTIIPLRTATSMTLREQTVGRGLRLPYGKRTGNDKVDKLTIVAHDKFQEIIDAANQPDSIIKRENIIEIDPEVITERKEVISSPSKLEQKIEEEQKQNETITDSARQQQAKKNMDAKKAVLSTLSGLGSLVNSAEDLKKTEIKKIVMKKIGEKLKDNSQQSFFTDEIVQESEAVYEKMVEEFTKHIIEIPKIIIRQSDEVRSGFNRFDLNTQYLNHRPVSEEILIKKLRMQEKQTDTIISSGQIMLDSPEKLIVNELIKAPEINYDEHADFLFQLAEQAVEKLKSYLDEKQLINVVQYHKREIGKIIYLQMMERFYCETVGFEDPLVYPFVKIEEHHFTKVKSDKIHHYTDTITPISVIPGKVFNGFQKACHTLYKFDSKTEKDFSIILENDPNTLKWMRPAPKQFGIYWKHNSKRYQPDFVVETFNTIYLIETKKESDIETTDVQEKSKAAQQYCKHASKFTSQNGGKPWQYVLIPHNEVQFNMTLEHLVKQTN